MTKDHGVASPANGVRVLSAGLLITGHALMYLLLVPSVNNPWVLTPPHGAVTKPRFQVVSCPPSATWVTVAFPFPYHVDTHTLVSCHDSGVFYV